MVFLGLRDEEDPGYLDDYAYDDEPSLETMPPLNDSLSRVKALPQENIARPHAVNLSSASRDSGERDIDRGHVRSSAHPERSAVERIVKPDVKTGPKIVNQVRVLAPESFNDAKEIGDSLKADLPVVINLVECDRDLRRRIVDFGSGLTFGLSGTMERLAENVFLMTPVNVDISVEERHRLREDRFSRSSF